MVHKKRAPKTRAADRSKTHALPNGESLRARIPRGMSLEGALLITLVIVMLAVFGSYHAKPEHMSGKDAAFSACINSCTHFGDADCVGLCKANVAEKAPVASASIHTTQVRADAFLHTCVAACRQTGGSSCVPHCAHAALNHAL
jgi:hypothetical protein